MGWDSSKSPFLEFEESCIILQQVVKMKGQSKIVVTLHCDVANCFKRYKKKKKIGVHTVSFGVLVLILTNGTM